MTEIRDAQRRSHEVIIRGHSISVPGSSGPVVGLLQGFNFPDRILVAPNSGPLFI